MKKEELLARLALLELEGLGPIGAHALLSKFGSAQEVFDARISQIVSVYRLSKKVAERIKNSKDVFLKAEKELDFLEREKVEVIHLDSERYPQKLAQCPDAPLMLFLKGKFPSSNQNALGVVGTRNMSKYGRDLVAALLEEFREQGIWVVSGLAAGIDGEAHQKSCELGLPTLGVMGTGMDLIYPYAHRRLAEEMLNNGGGIISEFTSGTKPDRENFPRRNRVVAGMVDALVVVEAGEKGGALITAELAAGYHREVFAYPGRVGDEFSAGCNRLIQQGKAVMIQSGKEIKEWMQWEGQKKLTGLWAKGGSVGPAESMLLRCLEDVSSLHLDELVYRSGLGLYEVKAALLNLEMENGVKSYPGGRWGRG